MDKRMRVINLLIRTIILLMLLPACNASKTTQPADQALVTITPGTTLQALDAAALETIQQELVTFMLNFIQQEMIGDSPPEAAIISWWDGGEVSTDDTNYRSLGFAELIKLWWWEKGQLSEMSDPRAAISQYRQDYQSGQGFEVVWGEYNFGILSLSADGQHAEIGMSASIAIDYEYEIIYTLDRNANGAWEITGEEMLWVA